jgi:hypothetical protein
MKRIIQVAIPIILLFLATACTTLNFKSTEALTAKEIWGVVPLSNSTETPYVTERATSIAVNILRSRGVNSIEICPAPQRREDAGTIQQATVQEAVEWAAKLHVRYVLMGMVTEWRYKAGLDGEPVAGITMQVMDSRTGKTVWSAVSGRSGWSGEALSSLGQKVINKMLDTLPIAP